MSLADSSAISIALHRRLHSATTAPLCRTVQMGIIRLPCTRSAVTATMGKSLCCRRKDEAKGAHRFSPPRTICVRSKSLCALLFSVQSAHCHFRHSPLISLLLGELYQVLCRKPQFCPQNVVDWVVCPLARLFVRCGRPTV